MTERTVDTTLEALRAQNESLQQELCTLRAHLRDMTLEQAILPKTDTLWLSRYLEAHCDFTFQHPCFCMLLLFNRPPMKSDRSSPDPDLENSNWVLGWDPVQRKIIHATQSVWGPHWDPTVRTLVETAISDALSVLPEASLLFLQADRDLCCLMNYPQEGIIDTVITRVNEAIEQLSTQYGLMISAAIGQERTEDLLLSDCYEECLMIHDYGWDSRLPVLTYDLLEMPICAGPAVTSEQSSTEQSVVMLERRFLNYATMRAFPQASHTLTILNDYLMEKQHIPFGKLVSLTYHRLVNVLSICPLDIRHAAEEALQAQLLSIQNVRSLPDLRVKTEQFFALLAPESPAGQPNHEVLAKAVLAYIEENYQSTDLGSSMICEALNISASYLSRIMKQQTGHGLVHAIHEIRLREAQHLLLSTELSLDQIASYVGFTNRWILIRSFKNRFGMTPNDYRQRK